MGLYKQVDTVDARTYRYHRIAALHVYTNRQSTIEITSYVSQEARDAEKEAISSGTGHDAYTHTWYFAVPYDETFNIVAAYGLLKSQEMFENLANPMTGSADRFEGDDAQRYIEGLPDDMTVEELIAASEVVRVDASGTADEIRQTLYMSSKSWSTDEECPAGIIRVYGDAPYRCIQSHTSQAGWEPPNVPALWKRIAKEGEIPAWVQPTGAHDAYDTGDKVHYPDISGPVYESTMDGNVFSPEAYPQGWKLVEGGE